MSSVAKVRVTAVVNPCVLQSLGEISYCAKVGIITSTLPCQDRMQRMMEIIAPLRVDPIAAEFARFHDPGVIEVAFGDQYQPPAKLTLQSSDFARELFKEMDCRRIDHRVHRVDPQPIKMIIAQPHQRVVAKQPAHFVAAAFIEIYRVTPWCCIAVRQVRTESRQIITRRTKVVVNDVEEHRE